MVGTVLQKIVSVQATSKDQHIIFVIIKPVPTLLLRSQVRSPAHRSADVAVSIAVKPCRLLNYISTWWQWSGALTRLATPAFGLSAPLGGGVGAGSRLIP